jgi:hypothetical protein
MQAIRNLVGRNKPKTSVHQPKNSEKFRQILESFLGKDLLGDFEDTVKQSTAIINSYVDNINEQQEKLEMLGRMADRAEALFNKRFSDIEKLHIAKNLKSLLENLKEGTDITTNPHFDIPSEYKLIVMTGFLALGFKFAEIEEAIDYNLLNLYGDIINTNQYLLNGLLEHIKVLNNPEIGNYLTKSIIQDGIKEEVCEKSLNNSIVKNSVSKKIDSNNNPESHQSKRTLKNNDIQKDIEDLVNNYGISRIIFENQKPSNEKRFTDKKNFTDEELAFLQRRKEINEMKVNENTRKTLIKENEKNLITHITPVKNIAKNPESHQLGEAFRYNDISSKIVLKTPKPLNKPKFSDEELAYLQRDKEINKTTADRNALNKLSSQNKEAFIEKVKSGLKNNGR